MAEDLCDPGEKYFRCSDSERAAFEAGIKLGAIYHQFIGMSLKEANLTIVERAMQATILAQPFVEEAKVTINREQLERRISSYGYASLSPEMLEVSVRTTYKNSSALGELRFIADLGYPLMYLKEVLR